MIKKFITSMIVYDIRRNGPIAREITSFLLPRLQMQQSPLLNQILGPTRSNESNSQGC